jgi:endonuclease/exonuclease/phosphatase family metal-dependent hydrolase
MWLLRLMSACEEPDPVDAPAPGTVPDPTSEPPVHLELIGFNIESGGSNARVIADEVVALVEGEALWGFSEVAGEEGADYLVAAAADPGTDQSFQYVLGTTGWEDRLVLAWDDTRFELLSSEELDEINVGGNVRAPLVGRMRERQSDVHFTFVVNHLYRSDAAARREQAELLNAWGAGEEGPIVMAGDYNFDWEVQTGEHNDAYDALVADDVFVWVRPDPLLRTQCSDLYNSVLDFVFVGGSARDWEASSTILMTEEAYCDANELTYSDHRPVRGSLQLP